MKLRLCPFCECKPKLSKVGLRILGCINEMCPCMPDVSWGKTGMYDTKRQAIRAWNKRSESPLVEALEEIARLCGSQKNPLSIIVKITNICVAYLDPEHEYTDGTKAKQYLIKRKEK